MRLSARTPLILAFLMAGCSADRPEPPPDPTPVPQPTLAPVSQSFRTQTAFVDNVLSIDVRYPEGRTRTLNTALHLLWSSGHFLPRPQMPGHSSREWLLTDNHHDGKVLLYATASWNDDDAGDYLAAGWWLVYPPEEPDITAFESATRGVFIDGPELDPASPPELPLASTATYVGGAGGVYAYTYGRDWNDLAGSSELTEFQGLLALTADFDSNLVTGCLGCIAPIGIAPGQHLHPVVTWQDPEPAALPADYDIHLSASLGANGAFEDTAITVMHPERTVTHAAGTWHGQFSNVPDVVGNPRRVVGSTDVHFAEADGSHGRFTGIFDALTPESVNSDGGGAD